MIENKELFSEIPSKVFHSAIFTSYSINLYYWDIQLVRLLNAKSINNISALIDDTCLSEQLEHFSFNIGSQTKSYSLFGYRTAGAFHPKIMFFVGKKSIMAMIGSGNLTTCGHGKNLELWNRIFVNSTSDPAYPIIRDLWSYIKYLYGNLGDEAKQYIISVESNCTLLSEPYRPSLKEQKVANHTYLRLFTNEHTPIINQIIDWTHDDKITELTVMSPFYDKDLSMVRSLISSMKHLKKASIIIQNDFGNIPSLKNKPSILDVYDWKDCTMPENNRKRTFHSKCIFLKGDQFNYLICGSANASVAAMGIPGITSKNQEASIGYKSDTIDYWKTFGISLSNPTTPSPTQISTDNPKTNDNNIIWIKEASHDHKFLHLHFDVLSQENVSYIAIVYAGRLSQIDPIDVHDGKDYHITIPLKIEQQPLYTYFIKDDGVVSSNLQYIIDSIAVLRNNPAVTDVDYAKRCKQIEEGDFVDADLIKFIGQILSDKGPKLQTTKAYSKAVASSNDKQSQNNVITSYEELMAGNEPQFRGKSIKDIQTFKDITLMDSIISFLNNSFTKRTDQQQTLLLEEEDEDPSKSRGSYPDSTKPRKDANSWENEKKRFSLEETVKKYIDNLKEKTSFSKKYQFNDKTPITFNELKQFITAIYALTRSIGFRYQYCLKDLEDINKFFPVEMSKDRRNTISELSYQAIAIFGLRASTLGFEEIENAYFRSKMDQYKKIVFEMSFALCTTISWQNEDNPFFTENESALNIPALKNLCRAVHYDITNENILLSNANRDFDGDISLIPNYNEFKIKSIQKRLLKNLLSSEEKGYIYNENIGYFYPGQQLGKSNMHYVLTAVGDYSTKGFCPNIAINVQSKKLVKIKT